MGGRGFPILSVVGMDVFDSCLCKRFASLRVRVLVHVAFWTLPQFGVGSRYFVLHSFG